MDCLVSSMAVRAFNQRRAFSLIEVVIATAIVAVGVTTVLALLAALVKNSTHAGSSAGALALAPAIQTYLQRRADVDSLDRWVSDLPLASASTTGLRYVAARTGDQLRLLSEAEIEMPPRDQFYLIELGRFSGTAPLGYETGANHLAVHVTITWPFRTLTLDGLASEVPPDARDAITFNLGIMR